ncbi:hypothetical protein FH972_005092 [Carpinus fangiana]|uniref:Protein DETOXIFICATION n=1 Tax=Carpinus fangiana TaxID=176857 RepID=A0A5N6QN77_9ROSI|nr:hypothetical protein FH972_005092 [Carpinus fangiana]
MQLKTLARPSHTLIRNPYLQRRLSRPSISFNTQLPSRRLSNPIAPPGIRISPAKIRRSSVVASKREELETQSIWSKMKEIMMFSGPATGLWICAPLMSLISTAVIGRGSSTELAALGRFFNLKVYKEVLNFLFVLMQDKNQVQHQISILLFVGLTCGTLMLLFTQFLGAWALTAFVGPKNAHIVPAASKYVQLIAAYMMIEALDKKGFSAFAISIPSPSEFLQIFAIAAPVFVTMFSKVAFYSLMTYFATAMGTNTVAAHQVYNIIQARMLLKSLMIIGAVLGLTIGTIGTFVPWLFPKIFTHDPNVIQEMHKVLILFFFALAVTPCTHSLEGTLLAGRELKFISLSMSGCFSLGALLLLLVKGYGLTGCWAALVGFQWARFFLALRRLLSPNGMLHSDDMTPYELGKLKAA